VREDEKTFHFARVTKMNDMFLDMNNTFAKRAKIESECAEKTCAKMCEDFIRNMCARRDKMRTHSSHHAKLQQAEPSSLARA
jgi:hypothetical protein